MTTPRHLQQINTQHSVLSAVEAAVQAGAAYVWKEGYKRGREDGWVDGWAAAFRRESTTKAGDVSVGQNESAEGDEEDDTPTLELTDECTRLFARSAKAQKRQKTVQAEPNIHLTEQFDLGGLAERRRRQDAQKMYGDDARQIAELEADLSASFSQIASATGANYWPVVSLRDGERPRPI